ncbi:MAG: type II toxin-antitoxin system death-on-curing family toxin [Elusimicrobia bacterium]|nr:type II toxin-antitoxin system death-on-curing family toxin [Elusimicrobiota bacterium]
MPPKFLTLPEILDFHDDLISEFGGSRGVRDLGLIESAVAMPQSGVGDEFFHAFPFEMAAAYAYHIAQNHPFVDGNKRTALTAALTFLEINGYPVMGGEETLEDATRKTASGQMDKKKLSAALERTYRQYKR